MANFTVRVELHNEKDYTELHEEMRIAGFVTQISKDGKTFFDLPTAEYSKIGEFTIDQVLKSAKDAAEKTKKKFEILVTMSEKPRDWYNLKPSPKK